MALTASTLTRSQSHADPLVRSYRHSAIDIRERRSESPTGAIAAIAAMPWFKSFRLKRKRKVRKQDISAPTDFKHCYHAVYDNTSADYCGLPPQWSGLVATSPQKESLISDKDSLEKTVVCVTPDCEQPATEKASSTASTTSDMKENVKNSDLSSLLESTLKSSESFDSDKDKSSHQDEPIPQGAMSKKSSIDSTNSLCLTKRPSPIIRGSDGCLDETLKYIRKVYHSPSQENESNSGPSSLEQPLEEEFIDIHFGSRSRANSMLQLRTSPINRGGRIVSYHAGSTGAMNRSNDRLPSEFCLSAPHDVVRSDLGLYDCENASECSTNLSHTRINSPSGSSGYFGSTMSSLYSSRMSSSQQISPSTQPAFSPTRPLHPYERETSEMGWAHPQIHHGYQHRFSSLQRPSKRHREPHVVRHTPIGHNFSAGHYGTTPRHHKALRELRSVGGASGRVGGVGGTGMDSVSLQRVHEQAGGVGRRGEMEGENGHHHAHHHHHHQQAVAISRYGNHANQQLASGGALGVQKRERKNSRMSNEQFRAMLEFLVDSSDPTRDLTDFVKIGEGSTGCVYKARQISRNRTVAVKKMNLWKQQRRELLFNEVSKE